MGHRIKRAIQAVVGMSQREVPDERERVHASSFQNTPSVRTVDWPAINFNLMVRRLPHRES